MESREAIIRQIRELSFVGKADSNHWTTIDSSHNGNVPAANSPMELLLIALGACTGSDVVSILEKKRVQLSMFEMKVTGERAKEFPKAYTKIHIDYSFAGDNSKEKDVAHAIDLSMTKYCSVSAMIKNSVEMTHSFSIIEMDSGERKTMRAG
jgi:putative redox protein